MFADECYEAITFGVPHVSAATFDIDGRVLTFFSISKAYAMTGWCLGYVHARDPQMQALLGQLADTTVACPSSGSQRAGLAALVGPQVAVADAVASYHERRDAAVRLLGARKVPCVRPDGAFYLMVDVWAATRDSAAFAVRLLAQRRVAVSPGSAFGAGAGGMVRVPLASRRSGLLGGLERLAELVQGWRGTSDELGGANATVMG